MGVGIRRTRTAVVVGVALGVMAGLGGCSLVPGGLRDEADGEARLLTALQAKYGQEFVVVENGELNGTLLKRYSGSVAPSAAPDETASARIDSFGRLSDGWAIWEYMDELAVAPRAACDAVAWDVASCDLNPHMPQENYDWSPDITVDQFVADVHPFINVQVEFLDTDPSVVGPLVQAMTDELSADPYPFNLYVTRGASGVVYEYSFGDPTPTLESILDEMR